MLFEIKNKKVSMVEESHFDLEKEIQNLIENNLIDIFPDLRLTFVKSELVIGGFRFDSLAFDERNKVFYILEYKNVEKMSLIDQGVAYLKTLLDRKAEFTYLLEELIGLSLKPKDVDWAATRVLFIAPSYNNYQLEIAKLNNAPFALYRFSKYGDSFFSLERIDYKAKEKTDFKDLNLGLESKEVKEEIKVYDEEDHLKDKPKKIVDLYQKIKEDGECVSLKDLAVNGKDLIALGVTPGKRIGEVLGAMLEDVIDEPSHNTKEYLLDSEQLKKFF